MHRKIVIVITILLSFSSCNTTKEPTINRKNLKPHDIAISVLYGAAKINIYGEALADLYYQGTFTDEKKKYGDRPVLYRAEQTVDKTFVGIAGEEFWYMLVPGEVLFIHILSANGQDAIVRTRGMKADRTYKIAGNDSYGIKTSFKNYH
jgi:hypothetical protein